MEGGIRKMTIEDYDEVYELWKETPGLSLEESDERIPIEIYLKRNPDICFVSVADGQIVGTVLCGHDGRRGILRHLVVRGDFQGQGIAGALVNACLTGLNRAGIRKCNTFVLDENVDGLRFWKHMGWYTLEDNYRTLQIPTENPAPS